MSKTVKKIDQICSHKEFKRFQSFHELFIEYLKKDNLPSEKLEKLFEDINNFEISIVPIAKKVGIDLSEQIDIIEEMWEQPYLTHPEIICAGWSGERMEEAIGEVHYEYEAKLQERKAAISNLDRVMVALYATQPEDKNQAPIFNIQNSNVIWGDGNQTGNLQVVDNTKIKEMTELDQKRIWSLIKKNTELDLLSRCLSCGASYRFSSLWVP